MSVYEALRRFGLKQFSRIGWNGCYTLRCSKTNIEYTVSPMSNVISLVLSGIVGIVGITVMIVVGISLRKSAIFDSTIFGMILTLLCCSGVFYVRLYIVCKYIRNGNHEENRDIRWL